MRAESACEPSNGWREGAHLAELRQPLSSGALEPSLVPSHLAIWSATTRPGRLARCPSRRPWSVLPSGGPTSRAGPVDPSSGSPFLRSALRPGRRRCSINVTARSPCSSASCRCWRSPPAGSETQDKAPGGSCSPLSRSGSWCRCGSWHFPEGRPAMEPLDQPPDRQPKHDAVRRSRRAACHLPRQFERKVGAGAL